MWIKSPLRDIRSLGVGVTGVRLGLVDWDREKWSCHLVLWSRCHVYSALFVKGLIFSRAHVYSLGMGLGKC